MISLSSIVKAKQLTEMPTSFENPLTNIEENIPSAQELQNIDSDELNAKKESILRQAIKKSHHIENEANKRADSLIDRAMKNSREIMENAEKQGYEEGYLRGLVEGASASEKAAEDGLQEIFELVDFLKSERKAAIIKHEQDIITIAFELAKKIMKQHVQIEENAIQKMLEEIILESEGSLKIFVSEYQKTLDIHIEKSIVKKMRNITKDAKLVLIKEEDVIMGETESGIMDMSVPVQLEQLKKAVDHTA